MKGRGLPGRVAVVIAMTLLCIAPSVRADIVFEPELEAPKTFESVQSLTLTLETENGPLTTVPSGQPLTLTYQVGYGDQLFNHPEHTPETRALGFQHMLEDHTTYLELWQGEPFTPGAVLIESKQVAANITGTETFAALEPGNYFFVFFTSLEVRDRAAYCARYASVPEDCADPLYFNERSVSESRIYFSTPLDSEVELYEVQPTSFAGQRFVVEGVLPTGPSNVLFLPGIKGSRLYDSTGSKLWEPFGNHDVEALFLNASGESNRSDIYVKEGDILSEVLGNNFYASLVNQMNALTDDGTLSAWKPIAYDWRLSLDDIVNKGVRREEKIYYQESTDTPYIEQSLKELAASSPTGKVSIVAHSNGGLVAKRLLQRLEANGEASLVDQIIFVGVPQSGAPQAMGALLYGFGEALPFDGCSENFFIGGLCALLGSRDVARELAENSPMAFHLLPSQAYFDQVESPVGIFNATVAYLEERNRYGATIDSLNELYDYLQAKDGGRIKPSMEDVASANVLDESFLNYARAIHESLDAWTPPSGVRVHQIAGWGENTIAGVEFYEQRKLFGGHKEMYRPVFVEDGDGVVPIPSALLMGSNLEGIKNYWVNLEQARTGLEKFDHSNLFEITNVRVLLRDILLEKRELPPLITTVQPITLEGSEKLIFFLHSPLTLEIYDDNRNHVGETSDGSFDEEIPDVEYGEFGDVKYIIAPSGEYDVVLRGKDSGVFTLDVQVISDNEVTSSFTLADVPASANTLATIKVSTDLTQASALHVDQDGDGAVDFELTPEQNSTVIFEPKTIAVEISKSSSTFSRSKNQRLSPLASTAVEDIKEFFSEALQTPSTVTIADEVTRPENIDVSVPNAASLISEKVVSGQTQTASAYDAIGSDLMNWLGEVLYNFWESLVRIFTNLFSKK